MSPKSANGNSSASADTTPTSEKSDKILSAVSGVSVIVLRTLQDVARFAPVPYLSDISSVALGILEAVQTFKSNKEGFKKLGSDTCDLAYAITVTCNNLVDEGRSLSKDLEENLRQLLRSLKDVQGFVGKQSRRSRVSRFLTYQSDSGAIQGYRDDLRHSLDVFGLQSDITIRELVRRLADDQETKVKLKSESESPESRPQLGGHTFHTFPNFQSGSFTGNIRVNNVVGDQHNGHDESSSVVSNSFNNGFYDYRR